MNARYTTELVVELATIGRVNISSDISIHHTILGGRAKLKKYLLSMPMASLGNKKFL